MNTYNRFCYLDMEFSNVQERDLSLVSCSALFRKEGQDIADRTIWLYEDEDNKETLRRILRQAIEKEYIFVAYVVEAEMRSLLTLFKDEPSVLKDIKFIDLYLEYRNLLNHNHKYEYGEQLIDGKIVKTTPPKNKWDRIEFDPSNPAYLEQEEKHHDPSYSLAACTFKLLGTQIDTEEKDRVRSIIIRHDPSELLTAKDQILQYNNSDIRHLPRLLTRFWECSGSPDWVKHALSRGEYAARTARMIRHGYPINREKVNLFTQNVEHILSAAVDDCLEYSAEVESFRWDKRKGAYVKNEKSIREWVEKQGKTSWRKTDGKKLSLSKDAFRDWYDYDSPGFAGAYCRYLKVRQSLNGFPPPSSDSKKGRFINFIGADNRVRPNFGIYSSQSSRSQPGATGYLWLKAKWMQNFLEAPKGYALASADFASQEFLVAAIISQDAEMIAAYESGDPYLAFGKLAGLIPQDGTKESHRQMREVCKTCVLGMSYLMSKKGLAPRLTQAMGEEVSEDRAEEFIEMFDDAFSDYAAWRREIIEEYDDSGKLMLSDGWTMWGDNDNFRSVANFPVQGQGAVIMRHAVKLLQEHRINVIATVHDSIVIEYKVENTDIVLPLFRKLMVRAFDDIMIKFGKTAPIRVDGEAWSQDYVNESKHGFKLTKEFIHEKATADYERYKKYFDGSFVAEKRCAAPVVEVEKKVRKPRNPIKQEQGAKNGISKNRNEPQVCEVHPV
jgi:DNA polymerase I